MLKHTHTSTQTDTTFTDETDANVQPGVSNRLLVKPLPTFTSEP